MNTKEDKGSDEFEKYFNYLKSISTAGRLYKKFVTSRILYSCARRFGARLLEVGSGAGAGILGAFPSHVLGLEINPFAVEYSQRAGFQVRLIRNDGVFPIGNGEFDCCVLDNVLEHIGNPSQILDECFRVTRAGGGLVVAVPGVRGFAYDPDHKIYYDEARLSELDFRWKLTTIFSMPFVFKSQRLSTALKQYCLVAVFKKSGTV